MKSRRQKEAAKLAKANHGVSRPSRSPTEAEVEEEARREKAAEVIQNSDRGILFWAKKVRAKPGEVIRWRAGRSTPNARQATAILA